MSEVHATCAAASHSSDPAPGSGQSTEWSCVTRTFLFSAATAVLALGFVTPAFAQDGPPPESVPADRRTFTGPRAGVLGYDRLQPGSGPNSSIDSNRKAEGLLYGGDVGYDVDLGGFVVGGEGEVTGSTGDVGNRPRSAGALGFGRTSRAATCISAGAWACGSHRRLWSMPRADIPTRGST